jgi:predicted metal-binding transcription factor (methanogenesis marker protein 9)
MYAGTSYTSSSLREEALARRRTHELQNELYGNLLKMHELQQEEIAKLIEALHAQDKVNEALFKEVEDLKTEMKKLKSAGGERILFSREV